MFKSSERANIKVSKSGNTTTVEVDRKQYKYLDEFYIDLPDNVLFNKGTTGCGMTSLALSNNVKYVIVVPFTSLITNKTEWCKDKSRNIDICDVYSTGKKFDDVIAFKGDKLSTEIDSLVEAALLRKGFKPSKTQFMIRGYGHTGFTSTKTNGEEESTFDGGTFAPIFLFNHDNRLMFEAELEFTLSHGDLDIGFEYADVMYSLTDNLTVRAGKFLLPFGTFMERLHP